MSADLRTDRLRLRRFEPRDAGTVLRALNDWEVAQWLTRPPYPYRADDFDAWLAIVHAEHDGGRPLNFAVAPLDGDAIVGCVGVDLQEGGAVGEVGYWFAREAWGRGFATEAVRALVAHALGAAAVPRLVAVTDPANHRSHGVLMKSGFVLLGTRPAPALSKRGARLVRAYEHRA
jgi:RimJ/RimL family protein N-acetyltransferase